MGEKDLLILLIIISLIIFIFIIGAVLFLFQYRKRRLLYDKEKSEIEKQHKLDLLNNQVQIQRETMDFIGREIHDSVTQKLTLASIYTQSMEFINQVPGSKEKLVDIGKIINNSLHELQDLSRSLTDNKLENISLDELIKGECEQVNKTGVCRAIYEVHHLPPIRIAIKSSLLRVLQEFIQNSIKHGKCSQVRIIVRFADGNLNMNLEDDGMGFEPENIQSNGIGLDNMRRRIHMMGGNYQIITAPGKGFLLTLSIPLNVTI
jgi:signal transduction histidine kinase